LCLVQSDQEDQQIGVSLPHEYSDHAVYV
jgi:hypothetical protein